MDKIVLLEEFKKVTKEETADIILPVAMQKGDDEPQYRAAEIHSMRLPDSTAVKKKAPYIINQIITGNDIQPLGERVSSSAVVRSIFCVYNNSSEEEGALMLLNLMERLRIRLLRQIVIGGQFQLDLVVGLEVVIYPDNTAPYFAGEMSSSWKIPAVQREV